MAVPKKRTGKSAQGHRRSNWKGTVPETTKCTNCGAVVLTHTVCTACGFYKGKAVSVKAANVDVVESKTESVEEVKAEEKVEVAETTEVVEEKAEKTEE